MTTRYKWADLSDEQLSRAALENYIQKTMDVYGGKYGYSEQGGPLDPSGSPITSSYARSTPEEATAYQRRILDALDQYGVSSAKQLPMDVQKSLGAFSDKHASTLGGFLSSPAVLLAAGGLAGVAAGGAGAAGAGTGTGEAAAGAGAGTGSGALGSGITATAAEGGLGAGLGTTTAGTGLSTGATGAGGITATQGALGTGSSLAPGYFASEAAPAGGAAAPPATGGGSSFAPAGTGTLGELALKAAPGLLGAYASDRQADAYSGLAGQYMAMGEPYRQRLSDLYNDPSSFLNSPEVQVPVQQGTNILARSLSTQGNPAGSGNALQELQNYATNQMYSRLGQERDRLGGFGGLTQYQGAVPGLASLGIGQKGNVYQALGGAAADVFGTGKKNQSLEDILRSYYA